MRFKYTLFRLQNKLRSPLDSARITGAESAHITEGVICIAHHHFVAATRFLRARRFCSSTTTSLHATYELAFCGATASRLNRPRTSPAPDRSNDFITTTGYSSTSADTFLARRSNSTSRSRARVRDNASPFSTVPLVAKNHFMFKAIIIVAAACVVAY